MTAFCPTCGQRLEPTNVEPMPAELREMHLGYAAGLTLYGRHPGNRQGRLWDAWAAGYDVGAAVHNRIIVERTV